MTKKILFICPSLSIGGSAQVISDLAIGFSKKNYSISVLSFRNDASKKYLDLFQRYGIKYYSCNRKSKFDFLFLLKIRKIVELIKPSVISSHLSSTLYLSYVLKRKIIFHTIHAEPHLDLTSFQRFLLKRKIKHGKIRLVACSKSIHQSAKSLYDGVEISLATNGIAQFSLENNDFDIKKIDFLCVGRFDPVKNFNDLVMAFSVYHAKNPSSNLCLCGFGKEEKNLRKLVCDLNIVDNVIFKTTEYDLNAIYQDSKVFCLFSSREGGPIVILEALAHGLPVICSNIPGNNNYISDGHNGLMFECHDYIEASHLMTKIMNNKKMYLTLSKNCLESAKYFTIEKTVESYELIFNKYSN